MKVYLAGPITGVPNFAATFDAATHNLEDKGHVVFNPAFLSKEKPDITAREALSIELSWICLQAEAIALLPGWEQSVGSRVEHELARALKLEFIYLR